MGRKSLLTKKREAIQSKNKSSLAQVCILLADLYKKENKNFEAIEEYEEAADCFLSLGDKLQFGIMHRMIGDMHGDRLVDYTKALQHHQIYLDVAQSEKNKLEEQRAFFTIGRTHYCNAILDNDKCDQRSLTLALKAYMTSTNICESLTDIPKHERNDMRARLLINIGNVYEHKGDIAKGIKFLQKAIEICQKNFLHEQLQLSLYTLGMLYSKERDFQKALNNLNEAYIICLSLSCDEKTEKLIYILKGRSEVFIQQINWKSAKKVLYQAYQLHHPCANEHEEIKQTLKIVASMYYMEMDLLTVGENDHLKKKKLYEKMGDGACELHRFEIAINYYKKMLECSEKAGDRGKDLSTAYISLAQTYKDIHQYENAREYFLKDLNLSLDDTQETVESFLNIAEVIELAGKSYEEGEFYFKKATEEVKKMNAPSLRIKVLDKWSAYMRRNNKISEAENLDRERSLIGYTGSSSESDSEENKPVNSIGNDINTSDISDDSAVNNEEITSAYSPRKRRQCFKIIKNIKGETQLHTACIKNNIQRVKRLLDQGHPVNVHDFCGWSPLHEACSYGNKEIVEILLENGANKNDRGGKGCNGITPLHDAAGNCHLEIVALLLEAGASSIVKCDKGLTALDYLRSSACKNFDESLKSLYDSIEQRLINDLKKAGAYEESSNKSGTLMDETEPSTSTDNLSLRRSPRKLRVQKYTSESSDTDEENCSRSTHTRALFQDRPVSDADSCDLEESRASATTEYKNAINIFRRRLPEKPNNKPTISKVKEALLQSNKVVDDWLEDDMLERPQKRRKTASNFIGGESSNTLSVKSPPTNLNTHKTLSLKENIATVLNDDVQEVNEFKVDSDSLIDEGSQSNWEDTSRIARRKSQISLLSVGFSRNRSTDSIRSFGSFNSSFNENVSGEGTQADSTTTICNQVPHNLIGVNVHIDNKIWRVPIPVKDIENLKIGWLAEEAAKRYYVKEGVKPIIQLETKDAAILDNTDPLEMVTAYNELYSTVISWNLPPIPKRYIDACKGNGVDKKIFDLLETCQASLCLDLSNMNYTHEDLVPMVKALKHQHSLEELSLAGNFLTDDTIKLFCDILPTLIALQKINLAINHITWEGISHISKFFQSPSEAVVLSLNSLNMSYNSIGDKCLTYLSIILKNVSMKSLNLASCGFTKNLFEQLRSPYLIFNLSSIEELDLSDNKLCQSNINLFLSNINAGVIKEINLAGTTDEDGGAATELIKLLQKESPAKLQAINLSRCRVSDEELAELISILRNCPNFKKLDISNNFDLTAKSIPYLFQKPFCESLNLEECDDVFKDIREELVHTLLDELSTLRCDYKLKTLHVTTDNSFGIDMLERIWECFSYQQFTIQKGFGKYLKYTAS